MVLSCAFCSSGTFARIAQRLTFFASVASARSKVTDLISGTVRVTAAPSFNAGNKWVALKTRRTNANRGVEINLTLGTAATNGCQARIDTLLVLACFV